MSSRFHTKEGAFPTLGKPWTDGQLRAVLPIPDENANKYSRGTLTVVAGSQRYPGAAYLASRAAQRMGAGYTQTVTDEAAVGLVLSRAPSLVACSVHDWNPSALASLKHPERHAVCVGPGFDAEDPSCRDLVLDILGEAACSVLVDGGGLAALASKKGRKALRKRAGRGLATIMTPHSGEAARLCASWSIEADSPASTAYGLFCETGAVTVLKGPDTFVCAGAETVPVYEGTAVLAKAGTGDVLAGMVSALLAQGLDPLAAAVLGATLHARAGNEAARTFTSISATPEDVVEAIPTALRSLLSAKPPLAYTRSTLRGQAL